MRFLLLFVVAILGYAESIKVTYDVEFGIFGKIGTAYATLEKNNAQKTYKISLNAGTNGMIKSLSGDRREYFYSRGKIVGDLLVPELYTHEVRRNKNGKIRTERKIFAFDHAKKSVHYTQYKGYDNDIKQTKNENLSYYARNDLLSLFFNFAKFDNGKASMSLQAVGAKNENGRIDIMVPSGKDANALKKELKSNFKPYVVFINQKIFSSSSGELHLSLNEKGYANKAILKDVLLFGDITGTLRE